MLNLMLYNADALFTLMKIHSVQHSEYLERLQPMVVQPTFWLNQLTIVWRLGVTYNLLIEKAEKYQ